MSSVAVRPPDHVFYFAARDSFNFGVTEHFGLIETCADTQCKLQYKTPPSTTMTTSTTTSAITTIATTSTFTTSATTSTVMTTAAASSSHRITVKASAAGTVRTMGSTTPAALLTTITASTSTSTSTRTTTSTTPVVFDCTSGLLGAWSAQKKGWCCHHSGTGCSTIAVEAAAKGAEAVTVQEVGAASPLASLPLDCALSYELRETAWSKEKKAWCCKEVDKHGGIGCSLAAATAAPVVELPFDCDVGYIDWRTRWSQEKRDWCCENGGNGCAEVATSTQTTTLMFDCVAGASEWELGWSEQKKTWCCEHRGVGCEAHPQLYHCDVGASHWSREWSTGKKAWCCLKRGIGCVTKTPSSATAPASSPVVYSCAVGCSNWQSGWSSEKKSWCCGHEGTRSCPSLAAHCSEEQGPEVHDCQRAWVAQEWDAKVWCCAHRGLNCALLVNGDQKFDAKVPLRGALMRGGGGLTTLAVLGAGLCSAVSVLRCRRQAANRMMQYAQVDLLAAVE